ncbi:MAG: hypothetical protein GQ477_02125 [Nanohaloarchaea archaeon]|nr:hypothetical protein [Candidatus Nanohaloarchaea archaeon]
MKRKIKLDIEHDKLQKAKDAKFTAFIERFDAMKSDMDSYEKKFTDMVHLLRSVGDSVSSGVKMDQEELDEKLQDIFKQL